MQEPIINSCSYIPWLVPNTYGFVMSSSDVFIDSLELFIDTKGCSLTTVCVCCVRVCVCMCVCVCAYMCVCVYSMYVHACASMFGVYRPSSTGSSRSSLYKEQLTPFNILREPVTCTQAVLIYPGLFLPVMGLVMSVVKYSLTTSLELFIDSKHYSWTV